MLLFENKYTCMYLEFTFDLNLKLYRLPTYIEIRKKLKKMEDKVYFHPF